MFSPRARLLALGVLVLGSGLFDASARAAEPAVRMFGASWCGPCRTVKAFLESSGVAFTYLDVDVPENRAAFLRESSEAGIPFLVIGGEKVRGANLPRIVGALKKIGALEAEVKVQAPGGESYGGHAPTWWQAQFRELRQALAEAQADVKKYERLAADDVEKERVKRMKEDTKILEASLNQLENDASNVSLPRKYRE